MKGLAFAVSLFHRLSAEHPQFKAIEILDKVDDVVMRLGAAGRIAEAAFDDAVTGAPGYASTVPAAKAPDAAMRAVFERSADQNNDQVRAIVGGSATPIAAVEGKGGVSGAAPAPTPVAPGIAGVPAGK